VRGDDERRLGARQAPHDVAQARMARDALEPPARQLAPEALGEPPRRARARRPRPELDLALELGERARGVEAIDGRRRGGCARPLVPRVAVTGEGDDDGDRSRDQRRARHGDQTRPPHHRSRRVTGMSALAVAAAAAVMTGAALQSAVGFGFALVAAPLLYAAAPSPEEAVGLMLVLGLEVNLLTLVAERRRPDPVWRDVVAVVAWSLPGALAGVAVLRALDAVALQLLVTAGVLIALAVNVRAATRDRRTSRAAASARPARASEPRSRWARPAAGVTSGALTTTTSTGGPPVVLLLMARGLPPQAVRDTLTASFVGLALVGAAALALTGTPAVPDVAWIAALVPVTAAGQLAGRPLFARIAAARSYERVLTAVLLVTVAVGLISVVL
jgi:uncharacterized membrane protein YfcA